MLTEPNDVHNILSVIRNDKILLGTKTKQIENFTIKKITEHI